MNSSNTDTISSPSNKQQIQQELEQAISAAIKKVNAKKENDICHYLPVPTGGYMHHFTMRKMKQEQPESLKNYLYRYIIDIQNPTPVEPKKRAARGSRKLSNIIAFTQEDLSKVLELARQAGDQEMLAKLSPRRSLSSVKKELISSIRQNKSRQDLWEQYNKLLEKEEESTKTPQEIVQTVVVDS